MARITLQCLCTLAFVLMVPSAHGAQRYRITLLPMPPDSTFSTALSISDAGLIAGHITETSGTNMRSAFWPDARSEPIDVCDQFCLTGGVNSDGVVVGIFGEGFAAFQWSPKDGVALLEDNECCGAASAVNDEGIIVGRGHFPEFAAPQACRWIDDQISLLMPLSEQGGGFANDVNALGHATGSSGAHAVLWIDDMPIDLQAPGETAHGLGLNDHHDVVGSYTTPAGEPIHIRPFLWRDGVFTTLDSLGDSGEAQAINNKGMIVGSTDVLGATIWRQGKPESLASLITNLPAGMVLQNAHDINAAGEIVGSGMFREQRRGFVAEPMHDVSVADVLGVLSNLGPCLSNEPCEGDVDENGIVDELDVLAVIEACCR